MRSVERKRIGAGNNNDNNSGEREVVISPYPAITVGVLGLVLAVAAGSYGLKKGLDIGNYGTNINGEVGYVTNKKLDECNGAPVVVFREERNNKFIIHTACFRPSEPFMPRMPRPNEYPSRDLKS